MNVVYKYPVKLYEEFTLALNTDSDFLKVDIQDGKPVLWVQNFNIQNPEKIKNRRFKCFYTGEPFGDKWNLYIGTFTSYNGYVFHLYEAVELEHNNL